MIVMMWSSDFGPTFKHGEFSVQQTNGNGAQLPESCHVTVWDKQERSAGPSLPSLRSS